jgi:hypothetical protein
MHVHINMSVSKIDSLPYQRANSAYRKISTNGPGAFRVEIETNPSNILFIPFSCTFNNTAQTIVIDTGALLPSRANVLYSIISKGSVPLSSGTIVLGTSATPGTAITQILSSAKTFDKINAGQIFRNTKRVGFDTFISIHVIVGPIATGNIIGKIFYTASLA